MIPDYITAIRAADERMGELKATRRDLLKQMERQRRIGSTRGVSEVGKKLRAVTHELMALEMGLQNA